jgi:hypothetical protein
MCAPGAGRDAAVPRVYAFAGVLFTGKIHRSAGKAGVELTSRSAEGSSRRRPIARSEHPFSRAILKLRVSIAFTVRLVVSPRHRPVIVARLGVL